MRMETAPGFSTTVAPGVLAGSAARLQFSCLICYSCLVLNEAGVAQLVEHLICNQRVGGSIPSASSTNWFGRERGGEFQ